MPTLKPPAETPEAKAAFCETLANTCHVGKAAAAAGVTRNTCYVWRRRDPEFAAAWDLAEQVGVSAMEDEAKRRAFEGVEEPLTYQGSFSYLYETRLDAEGDVIRDLIDGKPTMFPVLDENGNHRIATVKKYSDSLVGLLLKGHAPDKYAERSKVDVKGDVTIAQALLAARKRVGK